jgi:hypothetical protein
MKQRVTISDELAAAVMFASDRTCCICRLEKHKVQIHHIDENPSNNTFDNLAVICLHCHSDAHTDGAFVRNLTPELIRLYNSSWRDIVKLRLTPQVEDAGHRELAAEAFLQASLDCHYWKVFFMTICEPDISERKTDGYADVWDAMVELWVPKYSEVNYKRFLPLFVEGTREIQYRFDRLVQLFPDVLPYDFRSNLVRAHRQLQAESSAYVALDTQLKGVIPAKSVPNFFYGRFAEIIRVLRDISRDADKRRESLVEQVPQEKLS